MSMNISGPKKDFLLLVVRVLIGGIFILAGWSKVSDMATTVGYFSQMGIPAFLTYVVSYTELIGGVMVLLGMWTCLASSVLAIIMVGAIWFSRSMGFQGMIPAIAILAALLAFMASGDGKYVVPTKKGSAGSAN